VEIRAGAVVLGRILARRLAGGEVLCGGRVEELELHLWVPGIGVGAAGRWAAGVDSNSSEVWPVIRRWWWPERWGCGLGRSRGSRAIRSGGWLGEREAGEGAPR